MPSHEEPRPGYGKGQEELVQAVIRLVVAEGIGSVTHRRVAAEANVSHGLIRHYFGSIEGLIAAGIEEVMSRSLSLDVMDVLMADPPLPVARLLDWIDAQWTEQCFEYELVLAARRSAQLRPLAIRSYQGYADSLSRGLQRHGFPEPTRAEVELLVSAIDGIVLRYVNLVEKDDNWPLEVMAALRELLFSWRESLHKRTAS